MKGIALFLICGLACFAASSEVKGQVHLSNGKTAGNAVVFLEGSTKSKPMAKAVVDQRHRTFIPHISVVTVGTEVEFPNNDTVFHNVFAAFDAKRFDLGMYARGKTKVQTFGKPGLVALMCSIHSEMSAFIMVVDTPYYAVADSSGKFTIKGVPNGAYTLRVWHEKGEVQSEPITVSGDRSVTVSTVRK